MIGISTLGVVAIVAVVWLVLVALIAAFFMGADERRR